MSIEPLVERIEAKTARIGVIGLGYVGLPAGCLFADAGYSVTGIDLKADRVAMINAGQSPIEGDEPGLAELLAAVVERGAFRATTDYQTLASADIVLIVVDTPVDPVSHRPHYDGLRAACRSLAPHLKDGALVIIESTVSPGTAQNVVRPLLEEHGGKRLNQDFFLGVCPERVMPGKLIANLINLSRVCGGSTPETAQAMVKLYRQVVRGELDTTDLITAEVVKTAENAYRDVQIAFANEVAMICEAVGADVWRVRELVNKSPGRQMLLPGAGVGGHCIPKDPWLLASAVTPDIPLQLIPAARYVNDSMPLHMADLIVRALKDADAMRRDTRVAILGYAYLENSDDTRNSPSAVLAERLDALGIGYVIHDPWVQPYQGDVYDIVAGCDAAVFMVKHQAYCGLDLAALRAVLKTPIIVDGRRVFDGAAAEAAGFIYAGVGFGNGKRTGTYPKENQP